MADNFTPSEAHGFPPGAVVSTPILAVLVPRIQEAAEREGRTVFGIVNAALMTGLVLMAGSASAGAPPVLPSPSAAPRSCSPGAMAAESAVPKENP